MSMRTTEGGLTLTRAKGLPTLAIRPRSAIKRSVRARAEEPARHRQGFAMTGKEYLLVDAEARAKLLREGELSDLDPSPWEIKIHVTVNGYSQSSCWGARQLHVSTSSVGLNGSKGSETPKDRRTYRAQDLGQRHGAPKTDGDELYSKEHGNEAH